MMSFFKTIVLYGKAASCEEAKRLLEKLPQMERIEERSPASFYLFSSSVIDEKSLIPLLAQSGISGFRLIH